jgi:hypothetical protein
MDMIVMSSTNVDPYLQFNKKTLPEDGPKRGPKHVTIFKQNELEQLDWFIFLVVLAAKYQQLAIPKPYFHSF